VLGSVWFVSCGCLEFSSWDGNLLCRTILFGLLAVSGLSVLTGVGVCYVVVGHRSRSLYAFP
jgi:hypothetical protein